jgi:hypothetical protein
MPVAAVHEDDFVPGRENEVRFAWEVAAMEPESVARGM